MSDREKALLTTGHHSSLVDMVNEVKEKKSGRPGGSFYINEYKDVLVPTTDSDGDMFWAGTYDSRLEFELEPGVTISPKAPHGLRPGQPWPGPRVGTKYTVSADALDVRYQARNGRITTEVRLSDHVGSASATELARRVASFRPGGGSLYVNECGEMFIPNQFSATTEYTYVGSIDEGPWFNPPDGYDRP
jgi:hypothetical protein